MTAAFNALLHTPLCHKIGCRSPAARLSSRPSRTRRLRHSADLIFDVRKIEDHCLSPTHPRERHEARVFRQALDFERGDADAAWLRDILLEAARSEEAQQIVANEWGVQWRLDVTVRRRGKSAVVRTIWIVRAGEDIPRFVTCWVQR